MLQEGDSSAFESLVHKYQEGVRRLVHKYVKSEDDAKDIAQKSFMQAYSKIASFRGESSFRTWLYRIAVNLALNHLRGAAQSTVPLEDDVAFANCLETSKLVAAEVWRKVSARLEELPKQRLVLELRVFHDLSFDEVGLIAGCSEDSAKNNFQHAIKRLRALLPAQR